MIDFQQIIAWLNAIRGIISKLPPVINEIRSKTKTTVINGIEFIDTSNESPISNIRQLNEVLRQNGLDEIDESLLDVPAIDIETVIRQMQNDFTEQELANAIEEPILVEPIPELSKLDIDLADVCAPQEIPETPEFSENELVDVACEIPLPEGGANATGQISTPVSDIPLVEPEISADLDQDSVATDDNENLFKKLSEIGGSPNPPNSLDCLKRMQEVSDKIQSKVQQYTEVKQQIQEIQLDYFYQSIVNAYYQSFIEGYGEISSLRRELSDLSGKNTQYASERRNEINERLKSLPSEFSQVKDRSDMQEKMESVILSFSNQFEIDIDSALFGLIKPVPTVKIDKDIKPLEGKIKDIPDEFLRFLDSTNKEDPDAANLITEESNKNQKKLEDEFKKTVSDVSYFSFGFGLNQFLEKEPIDKEFTDMANVELLEYERIEKKYSDLKEKEKESQDAIDSINKQIMEELKKLNCESKEIPAKEEAGRDLNFKNVSKNPTIFDYAWWVKFSKLATIVNLVPVHWPVGLLIPTPSGLIRIPLPIIWIPLFVAPTDKLIAVIFIGQCGILPCPFIFLQHFLPIPLGPFQSNNPYFAIAIRGAINISSHEPLPPVTVPSFDPVFLALNAALDAFRNGVPLNFNQLVEEVRARIKDVERQATQYLVNIEKQASDLVKNAKNQVNSVVADTKRTAQLAIDQAKAEGNRLIQEARDRYNNAQQLGEVTVQIQRNVDAKIKEAQQLVENARELANQTIKNAEEQALALKKRAEDTIRGVIEQGKNEYENRLREIELLEQQYEKTLETLRDLISKIQIPAINLSLINLSPLFQAFSMALGSLQSLAAMFSPKRIQFGFPTEIDPKFSASLPLIRDELPPWERLSLLNIPFVLFLWKWCKAGKEKGGFFRDAF